MANKPNKTPDGSIIVPQMPPIEERAQARLSTLIATRDQMRQQMIAVENQIYALDSLLNPPPADMPPPTDTPALPGLPPSDVSPTPDIPPDGQGII
jgi:outer membrane protein TolC